MVSKKRQSLPASGLHLRFSFAGFGEGFVLLLVNRSDNGVHLGCAPSDTCPMFLPSTIQVCSGAEVELAGPEAKYVEPCRHVRVLRSRTGPFDRLRPFDALRLLRATRCDLRVLATRRVA